MTAQLTWTFAAVALGLAAIGVYAVVAYSVARRTSEFGVRLALGASRGTVARLALQEAITPVAAGTVVGLLLAIAASRVIETLLFEVSALDPIALSAPRSCSWPPPRSPHGSRRAAPALSIRSRRCGGSRASALGFRLQALGTESWSLEPGA